VSGDRRLADLELAGELHNRAVTCPKLLKDRSAIWVAKGFEGSGRVGLSHGENLNRPVLITPQLFVRLHKKVCVAAW
jgi:hypothetical protein